jgi:hypothetical protein
MNNNKPIVFTPTQTSMFLEKVDRNLDLILLKNGVYELKNGLFRNKKEDDPILSAGFNYVPKDKRDINIMMEIYDFFLTIYQDKEFVEHVFDLLTLCLVGNIDQQKPVIVWYGDEANGISTIFKLIKLMLGDLLVDLNSYGYDIKFQGQKILLFTEGQKISGRYEKMIISSAYLHYFCKSIDNFDEQRLHRMITIHHPVTFVYDKSYVKSKTDHIADPNIHLKFPGWIDILGSILCDRFNEKLCA